MRDVRVPLRIEYLVVDPVQDAVQLVRVAPEQLVQALPILRGLDLLHVSLADRVDDVSEMDPAPEHVHHVVQARDTQLDQPPLLQAGEHERAKTEHPLRRQVVDGQGGGNVRVGVGVVDAFEEVGNQCAVPVVDVNHIGEEIQGREHLEHGAAEVDRPGVVVAEGHRAAGSRRSTRRCRPGALRRWWPA